MHRYSLTLEDKEGGKGADHKDHTHKYSKVLFPGLTCGYASMAAAKNQLKGGCHSKQKNVRKIVFIVEKCYAFTYANALGGVRMVCHRLLASVVAYTLEEYSPNKFHHIFRIRYVPKPNLSLTQWQKLNE